MAKKKAKKEEAFTAAAKEKCKEISLAMKQIRNDKKKETHGEMYTQQYMADKIGCSRSEISGYERGVKKIPVYVLVMYAEILNVSIYSFLDAWNMEEETHRELYYFDDFLITEEEDIIRKIKRKLPTLSKEYLTNLYNNIVLQNRK